MALPRSIPLQRWLTERRNAIDALAEAHATAGEIDGPGRPLEIGRPLAHSYIMRVVAEFQGFTRDLHDFAAERMVELSRPDDRFAAMLIRAATSNRVIDPGNASLRALSDDFRRLGVTNLAHRIASVNSRWDTKEDRRGDSAQLNQLIALRNALAHGNQRQVDALRRQGLRDTVSWTRNRMPALNRTARGLDKVVWEHVHKTFDVTPW